MTYRQWLRMYTSWEGVATTIIVILVSGAAILTVFLTVHYAEAPTSCESSDPVVAYHPTNNAVTSFPSRCDVPPGWAIEIAPREEDRYADGQALFQRFRNERVGLSGVYRYSPDGYTFLVDPLGVRDSAALTESYRFVLQDDIRALRDMPTPHDGPVSIMVRVFENPRTLSLDAWLSEFAGVVNYRAELGVAQKVAVGEVEARRFLGDGLYPSESFLFMHRGFVVLFTGSFNGPTDPVRKDFLDMVGALALF